MAFEFASESMVRALVESYRVAKQEPERYAQLSKQAVSRLADHCSRSAARRRLGEVLGIE